MGFRGRKTGHNDRCGRRGVSVPPEDTDPTQQQHQNGTAKQHPGPAHDTPPEQVDTAGKS
jgi:hypothetical protein